MAIDRHSQICRYLVLVEESIGAAVEAPISNSTMKLIIILVLFAVCGTFAQASRNDQRIEECKTSLRSILKPLLPTNQFPVIINTINTFIRRKLPRLKIPRKNKSKIRDLAKQAKDATNQARTSTDWYTRDYTIKTKIYTDIQYIILLLVPMKGNVLIIFFYCSDKNEKLCEVFRKWPNILMWAE